MGTLRATLLILSFTVLSLHSPARADSLTIQGKALTVEIDPASGDYHLIRTNPAWSFKGSIGQPLVNTQKQTGSDKLGTFSAVTFDWQADGPKTGEIRTYADRSLVQFILTCKSAQTRPPEAFPALQPPRGLHLFSYDDSTFAPPRFQGRPGGTPWLMFDDAAHAAILSPASNFM